VSKKKYDLADLLKVRELREDAASKAVTQAQEKLKSCEDYLEKKKKQLEDYKLWRPGEEDRIFAKIMKKEISQEKLSEVKAEISILREKELVIEKEVEEAEIAVKEAVAALDKAKEDHRASMRELEKIKEHKLLWVEEVKKEEEFSADKEMEEFRKHTME
jgi:type III secretion protein O